ncbi:hypothetical protein CASFOL_034829 [Castilleja foliolosa]|uniref:Leucine-rich repeat-containing N-terminal plant-type domain-containing protein n=1 Tax=Castilleja foliolosa TaxID=1961234 RepID=A0ABD3BRN8_9LAMI
MESGFVVSLLVVCFIFNTIHINANDEVDALMAFKNGLSDPNNELISWQSSLVDPCTWFHVTCTSDSKVQRIDLGNLNLSGPLVPNLQQLTGLQYMELYNNQINGAIPKEFGNLTNLVSLDLYNNNLNGTIPEELSKLTNLKFLRLNDNKLQGEVPDALANLPSLEVVDLPSWIFKFSPRSTNGAAHALAKWAASDWDLTNNPDLCGAHADKPCS